MKRKGVAAATTRPLFENLDQIGTRLAAARHLLIFLDFDGTLAPIVENATGAQLPSQTRRVLAALSKKQNVGLTIISGRALSDLKARVALDGVVYAGNHGFEISGPGIYFMQPAAAACRNTLHQILCDLESHLRHIAGVEVEDKGLTGSVHLRRVASAEVEEVHQILKSAVSSAKGLFHITTGKLVYEIRPRTDWHKGTALTWIARALGGADLTICVGDDTTDEDAFSSLPEGITVKVGEPSASRAQFHAADPAAVFRFLTWLKRFSL